MKAPLEFLINSQMHVSYLQKSATPWKEIFTSIPMWSLIITHCGQNWGYWMLLTAMPTYMKSVLKFNIEEVRIYI